MQASMSAVGSWMSAHLEGPSDPSAAPNGLPQAASQPDRAADRDPRDHRGGADDDSRLRQARQQRGEQQRGKPAEGAEQQGSRRERRERGERGRRERVEGGEVVGERVRERAQRGEGDRRDRGDRRPRERRERAAQDVPAGSALQQSAQPSQQSQPADAAGEGTCQLSPVTCTFSYHDYCCHPRFSQATLLSLCHGTLLSLPSWCCRALLSALPTCAQIATEACLYLLQVCQSHQSKGVSTGTGVQLRSQLHLLGMQLMSRLCMQEPLIQVCLPASVHICQLAHVSEYYKYSCDLMCMQLAP